MKFSACFKDDKNWQHQPNKNNFFAQSNKPLIIEI